MNENYNEIIDELVALTNKGCSTGELSKEEIQRLNKLTLYSVQKCYEEVLRVKADHEEIKLAAAFLRESMEKSELFSRVCKAYLEKLGLDGDFNEFFNEVMYELVEELEKPNPIN